MRKLLTCFVLLLVAGVPAHAAESTRPTSADERRILALHEAGLKAHMDGDIDALLANQADDFLLVNRGEVSTPSKQDRRDSWVPTWPRRSSSSTATRYRRWSRSHGTAPSDGLRRKSRLAASRWAPTGRRGRSRRCSRGSSSMSGAEKNGSRSGTRPV